jgi:S-adenosylmethionine uptake transporter
MAALRPRHPWLVALRALLLAIDMVFVFYAFSKLPLADAYTMLFTAPMLVTALSVPLLGERVGWRRWSAVAVGFGGVLIVLRPGFAEINLGHIAALASSSFFALSLIVARRIGNSETGSTLLVSMMVALLVVSGPVLPTVYVASRLSDLAMLAGLGLLMGGFLLFDNRPTVWVIAGSTVIIASGLYILWRETVRRRQPA